VATINCPICSRRLSLPKEVLGRELKCPGCAAVFTAEETLDQTGSTLSVRRYDEPEGRGPGASRAAAPGGWAVGDRVLAPWEPSWLYPGTVAEAEGEELFVHFDDGDKGWVPAREAQQLDIHVGSRVYCRWKGGNLYYLGTVQERQGEEIYIHYDDGDREWSRIGLVRVPTGGAPAFAGAEAPPPSRGAGNAGSWVGWLVLAVIVLAVLRGCAG
jgi:hypothetical protein